MGVRSGAKALTALVCSCVLAVSSASCGQSKPSGTLVDLVSSQLSNPRFELEGHISGDMTLTTPANSLTWAIDGRQQDKGRDNATYMTMTIAGQTTSYDEVEIGQWKYERANFGPWKRSARSTGSSASPGAGAATGAKTSQAPLPTAGSLSDWIARAGGLEDKGIAIHYNRKLHRLEPKDPSAAALLGTIPGLTATGQPTFGLDIWVEDDGTLAGLTEHMTNTDTSGGVKMTEAMTWDVRIEKRSGVQIETPGGFDESLPVYEANDRLHVYLANMPSTSGQVQGRLTMGSKELTLRGTVGFQGTDSSVHITAGYENPKTFDEIVAGGIRYTSPDTKLWVDRGKKPAGTGLADLLASAQSGVDAGLQEVGGQKLHEVLYPADTLDVIDALGLDIPDAYKPGSRLRVWTDSAGKPAGFGASIAWGRVIDGQPTGCTMDVDVLFDSSAVSISVPKNAWKWVSDESLGIAFAVPPNWGTAKAGAGMGVYQDPRGAAVLTYSSGTTNESASAVRDRLLQQSTLVVDSQFNTLVDEQTAESLSVHAERIDFNFFTDKVLDWNKTKESYFIIGTIAANGMYSYVLLFRGSPNQKVALQTVSNQILTTVEFLK